MTILPVGEMRCFFDRKDHKMFCSLTGGSLKKKKKEEEDVETAEEEMS